MNTMLQVRLDEDLKTQASMVYDQLGLDLSSAVRMFLKKSVAVNGIPFDTKNSISVDKSLAAANRIRLYAEESGLSDMDLDEINEIISKVRRERTEK